jgi:hypothetical protein
MPPITIFRIELFLFVLSPDRNLTKPPAKPPISEASKKADGNLNVNTREFEFKLLVDAVILLSPRPCDRSLTIAGSLYFTMTEVGFIVPFPALNTTFNESAELDPLSLTSMSVSSIPKPCNVFLLEEISNAGSTLINVS